MNGVDSLKALLQKKKKEKQELVGDKKYVRKGELEEAKLKRIREEEQRHHSTSSSTMSIPRTGFRSTSWAGSMLAYPMQLKTCGATAAARNITAQQPNALEQGSKYSKHNTDT
jgi:hypothetical protein